MGKFLTTKEFINRANERHESKYDYSLVNYVNSKSKVKILCQEHGIFEQKPNAHIQGKGCIMCSGIKLMTTEQFIIYSNIKHKNKYDYSLSNYINGRSKIKIICPKHREFEQLANVHLQGYGCSKCSKVGKLNNLDFIEKAIELHGNKYNYFKVDYTNMHTKIIIICSKHGEFLQTPANHLKQAGCPICKNSKGETIISEILNKKNINYETQKIFTDCRNKGLLKFDFYLPNYNACIEFDGKLHFEPWSKKQKSLKKFESAKLCDQIKNEYCKNNNILLIRIKYTEKLKERLFEELNKLNIYKKQKESYNERV